MAKKWKTGDLVELKSGGPSMTVRHYSAETEVVCQWFDGIALKQAVFNEESLKKSMTVQ